MKISLLFALVFAGLCYLYHPATASTKGVEFWYAHIGDNYSYTATKGITRCYLYVYAERKAELKIHAPTINWDTTLTAPTGLTTVVLPREAINAGWRIDRGLGVHITASDSVSIIAHIGSEFIDADGSAHKEASLILPVSSLGHEYYVASVRVNHAFGQVSASALLVVATEDNTEVEITPSDTTLPEYPVGVPFRITLQRGEMFGLRSSPYLKNTLQEDTSDLTGSYIRATAPIAVYGGTFGAASISGDVARVLDYVFEQMTPVSMLGRKYILSSVLGTKEEYLCRIFAVHDSTRVTINGNPTMLLRQGEKYDVESTQILYLHSDKPMAVYQYIQNISHDTLDFSGNAFTAVQPLEQMETREVMFPDAPFNRPRRQTFLNIVTRTEDVNSPIELDGIPVNNQFVPVPDKPEYSYTHIRIPHGKSEHRLAALHPFIAYVYGSGGKADLAYASAPYFHNLGGGSSNLSLQAHASADTLCPDSLLSLHATLQIPLDTTGSQWSWEFGDGNTAVGRTVQHRYASTGSYTATLTITKGDFLLVDPVSIAIVVTSANVQSDINMLDLGTISPCATSVPEGVIPLHNSSAILARIASTTWTSESTLFSIVSPPSPIELPSDGHVSLRIQSQLPLPAGIWRDTLLCTIEPCGAPVLVPVQLTVLPGAVSVTAATVDLGILSGCAHAIRDTSVTIRNTGERDITLTSASIAAPFLVLNLDTPVLLQPQESYRLMIRFAPSSVGFYREQLLLGYQYEQCNETVVAELSGELRGVPIAVDASTDTAICAGTSLQLWARGGTTYRWEPATGLDDATSATPFATPQETTTYTVIATNESGCTGSSVVVVQVLPLPTLVISGDVRTCQGDAVQISATGAERYLWTPDTGLDNPLSATPTARPEHTTTYTVTAWRGNCSSSAQLTVEVVPRPVVSLHTDTSICLGSSVLLPTTVQGDGNYTYLWTPDTGLDDASAASPVAMPTTSTIYTVHITDSRGCSSSASVAVEVVAPSLLHIAVPDVLGVGQRFELPIELHTPPERLPLPSVSLRIVLHYPSQVMLIEGITDARIVSNTLLSWGEHAVEIEVPLRNITQPNQRVAVLQCRTLLSAQRQGKVLPKQVDVVSGNCVEIGSTAGGILRVEGYCQGYDMRSFTPLDVRWSSASSSLEIRTSIEGRYTAELYDSYGRMLEQWQWQHTREGVYQTDLSGRLRSSGVYLVRIAGMGQVQSLPVMIVK